MYGIFRWLDMMHRILIFESSFFVFGAVEVNILACIVCLPRVAHKKSISQ